MFTHYISHGPGTPWSVILADGYPDVSEDIRSIIAKELDARPKLSKAASYAEVRERTYELVKYIRKRIKELKGHL